MHFGRGKNSLAVDVKMTGTLLKLSSSGQEGLVLSKGVCIVHKGEKPDKQRSMYPDSHRWT